MLGISIGEQLLIWAIITPIVCTVIGTIFAYLWKNSIDKSLKKIDEHETSIDDLKARILLAETNLKHFREREESLIKMFKEEISVKIDHLNETFKLKLTTLEVMMGIMTKTNLGGIVK